MGLAVCQAFTYCPHMNARSWADRRERAHIQQSSLKAVCSLGGEVPADGRCGQVPDKEHPQVSVRVVLEVCGGSEIWGVNSRN